MSERKTAKKSNGGRHRAPWFTEEEVEALVSEMERHYKDLTWNGLGKPALAQYRLIWRKIDEIVSSVVNIVRNRDQCRKQWNDIVASARKKRTANASMQSGMGVGPPDVTEVTNIEACALAMVINRKALINAPHPPLAHKGSV